MNIYMLEKVLSTSFTSQKPDVNGEIIGLFSTYKSRKICRNNSRLSKKFIATYIKYRNGPPPIFWKLRSAV